MRKILIFDMISVDGFFAGLNGEIDWHHVDADFNEFALEQLNGADLLLFGRVTYDLMAGYWPTEEVIKNDTGIASKMNSLQKVVFSRSQGKTGEKLAWNNSTVIGEIDPEEIRKVKEMSRKDIIIYGSGTIVSQLTELGLIDEYRLLVNPVILGQGKTLFATVKNPPKLQLKKVKQFSNGNILLDYTPL